jgi:hypothetical protein
MGMPVSAAAAVAPLLKAAAVFAVAVFFKNVISEQH